MQLADHFGILLRDTVNLSQGRLDLLASRVSSIYAAIEADSAYGTYVNGKSPQGSWAHRTIINPVGDKEYDADFMLRMDDVDDWTPREYLTKLNSALGAHTTYGPMPRERKNRCVRVVYANSCHIDVVPSISRGGLEYIANYDTDDWERTDTQGFSDWMKAKDGAARGDLRRVIRLMKFLRDHKKSFTGTRSVILTTLLGEQVSETRAAIDPSYYSNVPTSLLHIVSDLDDWLQARPSRPSIADPSGSGITFDHRWSDESYLYFRDRIHVHAANIREAYDCDDYDESLELWQGIFGSGFVAPADNKSSGKFGTAPAAAGVSSSLSGRAG
ncbi:MAG: cyclic GMP-AMP synthase DncV-like nucleotidyltransferase [Pseudolysinimonas sp.]